MTFPLLSDADLTVHRLYGAYGEKKLYGKVYEGVIRSTFVIDGDGVIRVARIHPRYSNHERFLGILVQAGSHGGAHRAAKAAELVYCDVFDRDAQHVGKDKTSSPRCALSSSRLCMADSRTCPEASRLYMAGQSAETVGRGYESFIFEEQAAIYKRNTSRRIPKSAIYRRDTACFP